jgi:hypothetical protein
MEQRPAGSPQESAWVGLVDKLQAVLLMEGDFNFYYKWSFGCILIKKLYKIGYIPED